MAAFCRRHGVAAASLYAWKRRLSHPVPVHPFVEMKVADLPAAEAGAIEVCLRGGRSLRVGRGFDARLLSELVAVLEGLS